MTNDTTPAPIGADALREALWICVEHNALHFGETHNTVVQGRAALASAAQQAAPVAQGDVEDAARYQALAGYLVGPRTDIDDAIVHCRTVGELSNVIDTIRIKEGGNHE